MTFDARQLVGQGPHMDCIEALEDREVEVGGQRLQLQRSDPCEQEEDPGGPRDRDGGTHMD